MASASAANTSTNHIHVLNNDTFPTFVETHSMALLSFFHSLSPRWKRFAPVFEQTAQAMDESECGFGQIDVVENAALSRKFQIRTFPTIILFQGLDEFKSYHGALREKEIVSYLKRQASPMISTITADSLEDFKNASDVVVIGYFAPDDKASLKAFTSLANSMRDDYLFGVVADDALAKAEKINIPSVAVYKAFDESKNFFELTPDIHIMSASLKNAGRSLVVEFLPELHDDYINADIPLGYIVTATPDERARLSKMVEPLAKKYRNKILFGIVDIEIDDSMAEDLHLKSNHWPAFAIREPVRNLRFPLDDQRELLEQDLDKFVESYINGKLKPTVKSEPVPGIQKSPLVEVVALSYDEIVMNKDKDVFMEFYTQWCVPCKALLPTLEKLAHAYASDPTVKDQVTIGKMDAEANDFPDRDIRGFPWFKLYPASSKDSPVLYSGSGTVEDWAKFIRDNGTHKAGLEIKIGASGD